MFAKSLHICAWETHSAYRIQPVFTVKLGRGDEAGFYSFGAYPTILLTHHVILITYSGFIDTTVTDDEITYTPVDK